MLRTLTIVSLAAGGLFTAFNQDTSKPTGQTGPVHGQDRNSQEKNTAHASATTDGYLAKWISVGQSSTVELSRFAESRATDPEVKRFATNMLADHQALMLKLAPFVKSMGRSGAIEAGAPSDLGRQPERRNGDQNPADRPQDDRSGRDAGSREGGDLDHAALFDELGRQCVLSSRKELETKQGAEFDRCYVGMMVMSHKIDNDALTVFQRHSTPEFRSVLADAQRKTEGHLSTAKDFMQRLERKSLAALKGSTGADGTK